MTSTTQLAALLVPAVLSACTSVPYTKADIDGLKVCDADAMDRVVREGHKRNAYIQWVNCPVVTLRVAN